MSLWRNFVLFRNSFFDFDFGSPSKFGVSQYCRFHVRFKQKSIRWYPAFIVRDIERRESYTFNIHREP